MKIWKGHGSEHSMKLVMIGHFKTANDAKVATELIAKLSRELSDKIEVGEPPRRFSDEVLDLLQQANCNILGLSELEHFLYDVSIQLEGHKIILKTDESDVSAFFKLMIDKGARVEIYSRHYYSDADLGSV